MITEIRINLTITMSVSDRHTKLFLKKRIRDRLSTMTLDGSVPDTLAIKYHQFATEAQIYNNENF